MGTSLNLSLTLEPIGHRAQWPDFYIKLNDVIYYQSTLTRITSFQLNPMLTNGNHVLSIGFTNKLPTDTIVVNDCILHDKAIVIQPINIEGYAFDRFMHQAVYYPEGRPAMPGATCLGWNGEWVLNFSTPIFTWIHRVEHLGLIYDINRVDNQ